MPPTDVTIRVPATSANLGPGFDSLGLALEIAADICVSVNGTSRAKADDPMGGMALTAARAAFTRAGALEPQGLQARVVRAIPVGRGLGASAVARAAGLLAANTLMGGPLDEATLLLLGADLEGHADNIVPAMLGGLRAVVFDDGGLTQVAVPVPKALRVVLFVPGFSMPTKESRRKLPNRLSRHDATFNIGRAALLVAAVAADRLDALRVATQDVLHQPARAEMFPAMPAIIEAALEAGAHGAYLSGAGSTIAAWVTGGANDVAAAMERAAARAKVAGEIIHTRPSAGGARIIREA